MTHGTFVVVDRHCGLAEDRLAPARSPPRTRRARAAGVSTTSPTAYTPSTFVRIWPSTTTKPALVDLDAHGLEPDARRCSAPARRSRSRCRRSPSARCPPASHEITSSLTPSIPVTRASVCTFTPRLRNERATTFPASTSVPARIRGNASIIVTSLPMSTSIDANSHPIDATTDDRDPSRELGELEHVIRRQDAVAVEVEARAATAAPTRSRSRRWCP